MTEKFDDLLQILDEVADSTTSQTKILTQSFAYVGKYIVDSLIEKYEEPYKWFDTWKKGADEQEGVVTEMREKLNKVLEDVETKGLTLEKENQSTKV
jgi:hypothetical protein